MRTLFNRRHGRLIVAAMQPAEQLQAYGRHILLPMGTRRGVQPRRVPHVQSQVFADRLEKFPMSRKKRSTWRVM